jgi:hypothetical protein
MTRRGSLWALLAALTTPACPATVEDDYSLAASGTSSTLPSASCDDAAQNGIETDVDCGGGQCVLCQPGRRCKWTGSKTAAKPASIAGAPTARHVPLALRAASPATAKARCAAAAFARLRRAVMPSRTARKRTRTAAAQTARCAPLERHACCSPIVRAASAHKARASRRRAPI